MGRNITLSGSICLTLLLCASTALSLEPYWGSYVVYDASSSGDLSAIRRAPTLGLWSEYLFEGLHDDADKLADDGYFVVRGQVEPPVVSSTPRSNIGSSLSSSDTAPPLVWNDPPSSSSGSSDETTLKRVFKHKAGASGAYMFIPRVSDGLGVHELEGRVYFEIPCQFMEKNSINEGKFRLTPSFVYDNFSLGKETNCRLDLPTSVFDAGLTTSFSGNLRDFEANVELQAGVASAFDKIDGDAFYLRGRATGSLPIDDDRTVKAIGGVAYYDRIKYKLVPIAGVVWNPNPQNELRLVYPDPRWSRYMTRTSCSSNWTDWWFFVGGEIGGGRWYMSDPNTPIAGKTAYNFDYDDYRFGVGVRFQGETNISGSFEVGGAFGREIQTKAGKECSPKDSVYLKVGLLF